MSTPTATRVTVSARINKPVDQVWEYYSEPKHVTQWNAASDDWHCPRAVNDLRTGGSFTSRMEARDGSMSFDFHGTYIKVKTMERIAYTMEDGCSCEVLFTMDGDATKVEVTFDAETDNPVEMQRDGCQVILDRFMTHAEKHD